MSAMWRGRVDRLVPPLLRRASRSIWDMSPTSSRRLSRSRSRKCSSSRIDRPAWFFRGLPSVGTASGIGRFWSGSRREPEPIGWALAGRSREPARTTLPALVEAGAAERGRAGAETARAPFEPAPELDLALVGRAFTALRPRTGDLPPADILFREVLATRSPRSFLPKHVRQSRWERIVETRRGGVGTRQCPANALRNHRRPASAGKDAQV